MWLFSINPIQDRGQKAPPLPPYIFALPIREQPPKNLSWIGLRFDFFFWNEIDKKYSDLEEPNPYSLSVLHFE